MQKWKTDKKLYDCKRDENNTKVLDYETYVKEFLSSDPLRDWESFERCKELWYFLLEKREFRKKSLKILDCGTKDGQFVQWLNEQGHETTGIEIDEQYVKYAQGKDRNVIHGDICNINFPFGSFDVVFAHHVMGLCPNYQKAIEEMIRVVKLNGVVIFLNQIPGNPRKHYSLVNSPEELNEMLNNCKKHTVIFNDFWRTDEHVTILKRG